jgi:hypothetical protein
MYRTYMGTKFKSGYDELLLPSDWIFLPVNRRLQQKNEAAVLVKCRLSLIV